MNKYIERLKNVYIRAARSPIIRGNEYLVLRKKDYREIISILKECIEEYEEKINKINTERKG